MLTYILSRRFHSMHETFKVKKVHKVNIAMTILVMILLIAKSFLGNGMEDGIETALQCLVVFVLIMINYFLPYNKYVKGLLFALIPGLVMMALFFLDGYELNKHYIIMTSLVMAALYFKKGLLIVFTSVIDVLYVAVYLIKPGNLVAPAI